MRMVSKIGMARPATLQSRCAVFHTADLATSKTPCRCGRPVPAPGPVVTAEFSGTCAGREKSSVFAYRAMAFSTEPSLCTRRASASALSPCKSMCATAQPPSCPLPTQMHTRARAQTHMHTQTDMLTGTGWAHRASCSYPKRVLPLQFRDRMRTHRQHCRYRRLR